MNDGRIPCSSHLVLLERRRDLNHPRGYKTEHILEFQGGHVTELPFEIGPPSVLDALAVRLFLLVQSILVEEDSRARGCL